MAVAQEEVLLHNPILNVTTLNFTDYPTLKRGIDQLINMCMEDPEDLYEIDILLPISTEEMHRIDALLRYKDYWGESRRYNIIAYYEYISFIGWAQV